MLMFIFIIMFCNEETWEKCISHILTFVLSPVFNKSAAKTDSTSREPEYNTVARWMVRDGSSPGDSYEVLITVSVCTWHKRVFSAVHITLLHHCISTVALLLHISFHHHWSRQEMMVVVSGDMYLVALALVLLLVSVE